MIMDTKKQSAKVLHNVTDEEDPTVTSMAQNAKPKVVGITQEDYQQAVESYNRDQRMRSLNAAPNEK